MQGRPLVLLLKARKGGQTIDPYESVRCLPRCAAPPGRADVRHSLQAFAEAGFDVLFSPLFSFTWTNHDRLADVLLHHAASVSRYDDKSSRSSVTLG